MRLFAITVFTNLICLGAFAAEPLDYFRQALADEGIVASDINIRYSLNPNVPASRIMAYVDEFNQELGSKGKAWRFYRVVFSVDNKVQDCIGGISRLNGLNENQRVVLIDQCNVNFFEGIGEIIAGKVLLEKVTTLP